MRCAALLAALALALPAAAASRSLVFTAGPGAQPIADLLDLTGDSDRALVVAELGRDYEGVTEIRLALDQPSFRGLLPPGANVPEWAQGVAFPELNLIVVRASPGDSDPRATMRHELSHVAVGRLAQHPVPRWFLEGLATIQAGDAWNRKGPSLVRAGLTDGLFSFEFLDDGFPARASDAELAYAQSADFLQFLVDRSGIEQVRAVLRGMVAGAFFDDAFTSAMGATRRSLENDWRRSLARWELLVRTFTNQQLWWSTIGLLALYAFFVLRRRQRQRMQLLEVQEQEEAARALAEAAAEWADKGAPANGEPEVDEDALDEIADEEDDDEPPAADLAPKKPTLH